jgi:hypothetical protein
MRDEPVAAREIDDVTSAKMPARAARNFPRLVELFARQTIRFANDARDAIEERVSRKMRERSWRKTSAMTGVEQSAASLAHLAKARIFSYETK